MTALLLLGLLLVDPPPPPPEPDPAPAAKAAPPDEAVVRPAVPVPEAGFQRQFRESRQPEWGFTAAVGMALMLLLPLAVEVQFRTGGGRVAPSTAVVVALAL